MMLFIVDFREEAKPDTLPHYGKILYREEFSLVL